MKTNSQKTKKNCLTILIIILLIVSCESKQNDNNIDYTSVDTTAMTVTEPYINQDSIDRANALAQEAKERKIQDAKDYISAFGKELMNLVSPNTGRSLENVIIDSESTYNELTGTLTVVFESSWDAIPDFNPNSTYQTHIYKGKVTLYGNGETRQETIEKNSVLQIAIEANEGMAKFNDFMNKINTNE